MKLTITEQQSRGTGLASMLDMEAAVLLHSAFWLLLLSLFRWGVGLVSVLLMVLLPVFMVPAARQKVFGKYLVFYALVLAALVTLLGFRFFSKAFLELFNGVIQAVNTASGFKFVPFHTGIEPGREGAYLLAAEGMTMFLTSAIVANSAVKKKFLPVFLLTVIPVVAGFLLLLKPSLLWVALFLAALMLYVIHCSAGTDRSGLGETSLLWQMLGAVLAFLLLFLALFYNYSGSEAVQGVRDNVSERIRTIRYAPETEVGPVAGGDLNGAESLHFEGNTAFLLTMEKPAPGYLRDYVGSDFIDGKWQPLPEDAMSGKYLGLDQWLAQRDFYPWMQLSALYAFDANRTGSAATTQKVTVENVGLSSDKFHLFYEAVPTTDLLSLGDPAEQGFFASGWNGQRKYTYTLYTPIYKDYGAEDLSTWTGTLASQEGYEQYQAVEELYASFVHDHYLTVDDAYQGIVSATGADSLSGSRYQDIVYGVRKYLQDRFTYSEALEPLEKGEDALEKFATVTRSGYDAHFATLAALMFREAGVPSRYMEGFYLSPKDVEAYSKAKDVTLELYDDNAHSWVEIYEDHVGWVPVEVTPGYFTLEQEDSPQMTDSVKRIRKRSPRPYYDNAPLPEQNSEVPPVEQKKSHTWLKWLLGVAGTVLLLLAAWLGGNRYLKRRIMAADSPASTRFGYRFLMWLFRRRKLPVDKEDPSSLTCVLGEEYARYVSRVYRDTYSDEKGQLSPEERRECADYVMRQWKSGGKTASSRTPQPPAGE
ncbi:MAG: transglutaminase domain-containing protein [Clostridia bacterium]|nr:transglutaminase domain-containing protein [Clostridia bacterium]MBR1704616.1 transglutaminase domain-containing protein [Clostridia bacterium]